MGLRPWIPGDCAKAGIFVAAGSGVLNLTKYGEDGAIRSTVSGIGLTRCLNEGIVMVSETRVLKTGDRWNNRCFNKGCRQILFTDIPAGGGVTSTHSMRTKGVPRGVQCAESLSRQQRGFPLLRRAPRDSRGSRLAVSPTLGMGGGDQARPRGS